MTPRMVLEGIYTPLITPFQADGSFDLDALAELIERLIGKGVHGLISGGSTGENYAQTVEERLELARFITERANGRLAVHGVHAESMGLDDAALAALHEDHEICHHAHQRHDEQGHEEGSRQGQAQIMRNEIGRQLQHETEPSVAL